MPDCRGSAIATITLRPNGDGTRAHTGSIVGGADWSKTGAGSWYTEIDDDPDSHDSDTTYVQGPRGNGPPLGTAFFLLEDVPSDFDPDSINSISLKFAAKRTQAAATVSERVYAQLYRSDESTVITEESTIATLTASYALYTRSVLVSGTHTKTDWDGARIRLRTNASNDSGTDVNQAARITAVEVVIDYTPASGATVSRARLVNSENVCGRINRANLVNG